jgi:hypothetical protein
MPLAFPGGEFFKSNRTKRLYEMKIDIHRLYRFAAVLSASLLLSLAACSSGGGGDDEPAGPVDNPSLGEMTAETAKAIFAYQDAGGAITITRFKSVSDLEDYLGGRSELVLNKIDGKPVTAIAADAFNVTAGADRLADAGVASVALPETLTSIGNADSFRGAGISYLLIPAAVKAAIEESNSGLLDDVAAAVSSEGADIVSVPSGGNGLYLGEGVTVKSDGSLSINALIYDGDIALETPVSGTKAVKVVSVKNFGPAGTVLATKEDAVKGDRITIDVPAPTPQVWNVSGLTVSPANLKVAMVDFRAANSLDGIPAPDGEYNGDNIFLYSDPRRVFYFYADGAGRITGETSDINLRQGWNVVIHDKEGKKNKTGPSTLKDGSVAGFVWRYNPPDY